MGEAVKEECRREYLLERKFNSQTRKKSIFVRHLASCYVVAQANVQSKAMFERGKQTFPMVFTEHRTYRMWKFMCP